jgi:hypothetical protein
MEQVAELSLSEAQVLPDSEHHRWCGQAVVEHLILDFQHSRNELQKRLKSGEPPSRSASLLQWILKTQVCFFGRMSDGVSASLLLRPDHFFPQDGPALAARLLAEAEELNKALSKCRIVFGLRPCGYHPMYGPLRVEEWRVYLAVHCRHHQRQFEQTIRFARKYPAGVQRARAELSKVATQGGNQEELRR